MINEEKWKLLLPRLGEFSTRKFSVYKATKADVSRSTLCWTYIRQTARLTNECCVDCDGLRVRVPEVGGTEEHHVSGHGVEDETLAQLHHEDAGYGELPVPGLQDRRGLVRWSDTVFKYLKDSVNHPYNSYQPSWVSDKKNHKSRKSIQNYVFYSSTAWNKTTKKSFCGPFVSYIFQKWLVPRMPLKSISFGSSCLRIAGQWRVYIQVGHG